MSLQITPENLTAGGTAEVCYTREGEPSPVTVTVTNDGSGLQHVHITLNDSGHGCASWNVPYGWHIAHFNAPGCDQVDRIITAGSPAPSTP